MLLDGLYLGAAELPREHLSELLWGGTGSHDRSGLREGGSGRSRCADLLLEHPEHFALGRENRCALLIYLRLGLASGQVDRSEDNPSSTPLNQPPHHAEVTGAHVVVSEAPRRARRAGAVFLLRPVRQVR